MRPTVALLHTSPTLTPLFGSLCAQLIPEAKVVHFVDESLIKNTIASGRLERRTMRRTIGMIGSALESGADAVMVTCSSIGPGVDIAMTLFDEPVLRVDLAMAQAAVARGRRIGVVATLPTTLQPTRALVERCAAEAGKPVEMVDCLAEGAFEALMGGDPEAHDRIVTEAMGAKLGDVDVVVLAQASIARVVEKLPDGLVKAPVLSSPELGVRRLRQIVLGDKAKEIAA